MVIIGEIKKIVEKLIATRKARAFVSYLESEIKLPIQEAYLFGSFAKKTQRKWSDIDVCIVSPHFKDENVDPISYLWRHRRDEDMVNQIEPVGFSGEDFADDNDPVVHEIKKTGLRIA